MLVMYETFIGYLSQSNAQCSLILVRNGHGLFKLLVFSQFQVSGAIRYIHVITVCVLYVRYENCLNKTGLFDLTLNPFS